MDHTQSSPAYDKTMETIVIYCEAISKFLQPHLEVPLLKNCVSEAICVPLFHHGRVNKPN
jgi:hypothetical protein